MKAVVIGLDSAPASLVLGRWRDQLPHLAALMQSGSYGVLESTNPPITVPAWSCMMTGLDPGQLGFYGFRNRGGYDYEAYTIASAADVRQDRLWDILSNAGQRVILVGVPQTYPVRPLNGCVVSDFLTPSTQAAYTFPLELKDEVERVSGGYVLDVTGFRTEDKAGLLERVYAKTRKHFAVAKHLMQTQPWDYFMVVEMGTDRIQHGFWSYMDPGHPKYHQGNPFESAMLDYYRYLDGEVGDLLSLAPRDAAVLVVSDHGAKGMDGGIAINEWLIREGYLTLKTYPTELTPLSRLEIDWDRTMAWGEGGYHGRLFLNVRGREPHGAIAPQDYDKVVVEIKEKIAAIADPAGRNIGSRAYRPEELYQETTGIPPDLTVYFGNMKWRSMGSVGLGAIHTFENDTGPDEANHDWDGILVMNDEARRAGIFSELAPGGRARIYEVAGEVRRAFGM